MWAIMTDFVSSFETQIRVLHCVINKEVFVKHEKAPTAIKLEGVWYFVDLRYILYKKPLYLANLTTTGRVFLTEMVKRHIYGPRLLIWAYNHVYMTFRSQVLARTSSSLENPLFWVILANLTTSGRVFCPKWSKGTSTDQDLSFEPITKSLRPRVQAF